MISKEDIRRTVEKAIEGTPVFIVDISVSPDDRIVVEIDSPQPLDIDTCAVVTRAIEADFDRDTEDYELEVGSAGLTAPFKVHGQYEKNVGQTVDVLTADGRKLRGTLVSAGDDAFVLRTAVKVKNPGDKRPHIEERDESLPYDAVKKVQLHLEF